MMCLLKRCLVSFILKWTRSWSNVTRLNKIDTDLVVDDAEKRGEERRERAFTYYNVLPFEESLLFHVFHLRLLPSLTVVPLCVSHSQRLCTPAFSATLAPSFSGFIPERLAIIRRCCASKSLSDFTKCPTHFAKSSKNISRY